MSKFSTFFPLQKNLILIFLFPILLLFTTESSRLLIELSFYISVLVLFFINPKTHFSYHFKVLIILLSIPQLIQLIFGVYGSSLGRTVISVAQNIAIILWLIIVYVYSSKFEGKLLSGFAYLMISCGVLLSIASWIILIPGIPKPNGESNLFYPVAGHNNLASYLLFLIPLLPWFYRQEVEPTYLRKFKLGVIIFILISFLFSFSRSSYLALTITILSGLLIIPKNYTLKKIALGISFISVNIIILIWIFGQYAINENINLENIRKYTLARQIIKPLSGEIRLKYWETGIRAFLDKPLFGNGEGTFSLSYLKYRDTALNITDTPLNIWIKKLSEEGIVGTFLFVVLIIYLFKLLAKNNEDQTYNITLAFKLSLFAVFIQSHLDFNLEFISIKIFFWSIVGFLLGKEKNEAQ